jgi:S-adenosylmethionine:tRNA ribosyltransferase-isomerase
MCYKLNDYDFDLPAKYIAQTPLVNRTESKLFVLNRLNESYQHQSISSLPEILNSNDVLVFNKSRVIPARIKGDWGEILLVKPFDDKVWQCLVSPGKNFKLGQKINLPHNVNAQVQEIKKDGTRKIQFTNCENFSLWLEKVGVVPLPPYIKTKLNEPERYQTVFSNQGQSVAAPTAGLHFSQKLIDNLIAKGVEIHYIHLDVGLGTFLPVKTENIKNHKMHAEYFNLSTKTTLALNKAKKEGKRIIPVGTTSIRVLETCSDKKGVLSSQQGETDIFIFPGYKFKFIDALLTNFHTPKSTLLMLVSALVGRQKILAAYEEAKKQNYRFYSFGDAMLIL